MEDRKVFQQGTSLGVVLPSAFVEKMDLKEGDILTLSLEVRNKGKFIAVYKK